jgi:uncharacterized repeat protein (TIGR01451 family)
MPSRGSLALMPRTRRGFVLFWAALLIMSLALQYVSAMAPQRTLAAPLAGAVFTSNIDGTQIDQNIYDNKSDVYLTGGPCQGGSHLPDGDYYFEVDSPNGTLLSSDTIGDREITIAGGFITTTSSHTTHDVACTSDPAITVQLLPYNDTPNPGGEYKLIVATKASVEACKDFDVETNFQICNQADQKSDNFKVGPNGDLKLVKAVDGGDASGTFTFHVDCGDAFNKDVTVTFPSPGTITVPDLPAGTQCTVTETGMPSPPANFHWGNPTVTGSPATIGDGTTVTVTVTNHLVRDKGSLKIVKDVTGAPEGFSGSFDVHVDCGQDGSFNKTISWPDPGSVTIDDIPAGAHCAVTETGVADPPSGFEFNDPQYSGSPATIKGDSTVTVTVTNPLEQLPPPNEPDLTIRKSNNSPGVTGVAEHATVHFTLNYTLTNGPVDNGVITDVLPAGLTYVANTATNSDEFTFISYTAATRTLRWEATQVTKNGKLEYDATVDPGAAGKAQPLVNTATIDSDQTDPHTATSNVFVAPPPQAETSVPKTAPPTDTSIGSNDSSASGTSLLLILLALAGIALAVVFVAPTPASVRKRMR